MHVTTDASDANGTNIVANSMYLLYIRSKHAQTQAQNHELSRNAQQDLLQVMQLMHLLHPNYNTNDIKSRPTRIVPSYPAFSASV